MINGSDGHDQKNTTDQNQETKPIDIQGNVTEKPENKKDNKSSEDQENPSDSDNNQNDQNPTTNPDDNQQPENPTENPSDNTNQNPAENPGDNTNQTPTENPDEDTIRIGQKRIHREIRQIQPGILRRVCSKTLAMMSEKMKI